MSTALQSPDEPQPVAMHLSTMAQIYKLRAEQAQQTAEALGLLLERSEAERKALADVVARQNEALKVMQKKAAAKASGKGAVN